MTTRPLWSEPSTGDRVEVYYNLHKQCLSYRRLGGRVHHTDTLSLADVTFTVQPAGRNRVLREGRKNVHAYIRGIVVDSDPPNGEPVVVTYNPYIYHDFVTVPTGEPIRSAPYARVEGKRVLVWP